MNAQETCPVCSSKTSSSVKRLSWVLSGTQPVQLYQGGGGFRVPGAREALFQIDAGVQTPFYNSHQPRGQVAGLCLTIKMSVSS